MLRLSSTAIRRPISYICRRCLSRLASYEDGAAVTTKGFRSNFSQFGTDRYSREPRSSFTVTHGGSAAAKQSKPDTHEFLLGLRKWEQDHESQLVAQTELPGTDTGDNVSNDLGISLVSLRHKSATDADEATEGVSDIYGLDSDSLLDIGSDRIFFRPGDLVELTAGSQNQLAIFIRDVESSGNEVQSQFYTVKGTCLQTGTSNIHFRVQGFVSAEKLESIMRHFPSNILPHGDMKVATQDTETIIPREIGKPVLQKMISFLAKSAKAYQASALQLDNAHTEVAFRKHMGYRTLEEIATAVLPHTITKADNGEYESHVLYAVHRAIMRNDLCFRAQIKGALHAGGQYEISSKKDLSIIQTAHKFVREYRQAQSSRNASGTALEVFAGKARKLVDFSRRSRPFTPHGTIAPWTGELKEGFRDGIPRSSLGRETNEPFFTLIKFLELWTALGVMNTSSPLNGIGSEILRSIERYDEAILDETTAFTFLQEIGAIPPWESRAPYQLRIDDTGRVLPSAGDTKLTGVIGDKLKAYRKDWNELPVYCIDDLGAHEIDDGISVERTETPDEHWVHIHVADPAAHISPTSNLALRAQMCVQTVYMPDRVVPMLPTDFTENTASLANGRPCLTISMRMNSKGEVLDHKIQPGKVQTVVNITPSTMKEFLQTPDDPMAKITYQVGLDVSPQEPARPIHRLEEFSDRHKEELNILHGLGMARNEHYKNRGGIHFSSKLPNPSVVVSFNGAPWHPQEDMTQSHYYPGDPTIQVTVAPFDRKTKTTPAQQNFFLQYIMLAAGEVAAKWCAERGIPVPYRVTPRNPATDPYDFFLRHVLPSRDAHGNFDKALAQKYTSLIGRVQMSTVPGPHATIGAEMMVKATSPLRRYCDLLLHWQIEAALVEEARTGKSLVGNTREDFLPYSKQAIDAILVQQDTRERLMKFADRSASRQWLCHFLLRAWKFKQAEIPDKLTYMVHRFNKEHTAVRGVVTDFLANASAKIPAGPEWEGLKEGDLLEVELTNIDVFKGTIDVNILGKIEDA